jgi:tetratricopeptide (TPR) repeat protein
VSTAGAIRAVIASVVARDDPTRALELASEALELDAAARGPDHPTVALDLEWRAVALRRLERVEEAVVDLTRAIELRAALAGPEHASLYTARIELAHLDLGRGNTRDAERGFVWARDVSRARGDPVLEGWAEVALAQLYGLDRPFPNAIAFDPEAALSALDRADRLFDGNGARGRRGSIAALVARSAILSRLGRTEDALAAIERAIAIEREAGLPVTRAELLDDLARPDAVAEFDTAVAAIEADPRSTPIERARAHWLFASALRAASDLPRMRTELAAAARALSESRARDAELAGRIEAFAAAYAE